MNTTLFLAHIWGPIIFAVGLGIFTSRAYYTKIYRDLEKDTLAVLTFGMFAMFLGITQIIFHNVWGSFTQGLISFLGWGLLAKGTAFIVFPNFVDKTGDLWVKKGLLSVAGASSLVIGGYLSWIAYFA